VKGGARRRVAPATGPRAARGQHSAVLFAAHGRRPAAVATLGVDLRRDL